MNFFRLEKESRLTFNNLRSLMCGSVEIPFHVHTVKRAVFQRYWN
jgi:hypothetical protein